LIESVYSFYLSFITLKRLRIICDYSVVLSIISTVKINSMGYIVPFLTISSILIDVCINNVIFIGAIFNSYNYWYLLSYSNQFTLHYSILFLIISINIIPLIYCYFRYYFQIKFSLELLKAIRSSYITLLFNLIIIIKSLLI
jgi:hypothetical protein